MRVVVFESVYSVLLVLVAGLLILTSIVDVSLVVRTPFPELLF